jgi:PPOX class probable F420-dependent enzyme
LTQPGVLEAGAEAFLTRQTRGVLITLRRNGRPQASNIGYGYRNGLIRISVTSDRAKTRNLARDARAALHVTSPDFWQYIVVDGTAELSPVSTSPADEVGLELAELYEDVAGKPHPDWDDFYRAMVTEQRLVIRLRPEHAYGQVSLG